MMEQDIRWIQRLDNYDKALVRLRTAARIIREHGCADNEVDDLLKEGLVQRFEYTQELAWKVMKDYEEYQGYTDVQGSRDAIRKGLQMGLVEDSVWMDTISSRNLTSHCYDEEEFNEVLDRIIQSYLPVFEKFSARMNALRDSELSH
ncbi:MAG TPA: nucleotidyltransferase [Prevotellaceae bacterium]|nr:nucleotidyltransferase [Prevotellaceae bacterium]HBE55139.1 nucleotidyltransferase [Prevotellaceae bacterium]